MKWWCRISMQVSAENTDDAIDRLRKIMPAMGEAVAEKLRMRARDVAVDSWVVVPYMAQDPYGDRPMTKKWWKSKTINWGHVQTALGLVGVLVGYFTPANFPNFPPWAYGVALMVGGVITYALRKMTETTLTK